MSVKSESIFWHVYPLSACGAQIHGEHDPADRLRAMLPWVEEAAELGCSALLLAPIFQSTAHGYDTLDHFRIDDRLGGADPAEADAVFGELVEACRERGLDIWLDGVFNHVGVQHPLVEEGSPLIARDDEGQPLGWEGDGTLALLDHSRPETEDLVVDVMCHWLERGITGWRLDVAYAVPSEFWSRVVTRVRERFPEAGFLGEMIHGDYVEAAAAGQLDTMTQYEVWKAVWSSLQNENFWELDHALGRHAEFQARMYEHGKPGLQTFIGNHDVERVCSLVGAEKAGLAAVALLTLPGIPSIYYGDERGAEGRKGEGVDADAALRPSFDELPEPGELTQLYRRLIGLRGEHGWIAEGDLEVVEKSDEAIAYVVRARGEQAHELAVNLSVADGSHAAIHIDGAEALVF
ncbi:alpha-amylase family glycosyl hydrolase [Corynebacterium uterequi]|uniref:Glycosidase n=1 Tax=Corynebacterium uterequi TaxID=1072256 RepID=A0A0G3HBK7_9CORY|nr:alpha-amylase family glycosyl hydrolase [Corynebacterium uterequi]AKK10776.1 glycosidase [Corynebacterium uterequi]